MVEQKITVLIVDDDPDFLQMTRDMLLDTGRFRVFTASSGMEGFAKVRNLKLDILISDVKMPKMSGIELFDAQMKTKAMLKIPVLFVTGSPEQVTAAILRRPLTEVLAKPFEEKDFVSRILGMIKKSKVQDLGSTAVDAKIMDAFVQSTTGTFKSLLRVNRCEQGKLFLLNANSKLPLEITAAIHLNEKSFHGNLMLSFPQRTLNKLFCNDQVQIETKEKILQRTQELAYMIWIQTADHLLDSKEDLKKIIPEVVFGGPQRLKFHADAPVMVIPFTTEHGEFYMMFSATDAMQKLTA